MQVSGKGPSAPGLLVWDPACFPRTWLYEASSTPGTWLSPQFNWCPDSSCGHVALEQESCPGALGGGSLRLRYPIVSTSLLAQMVKNLPATWETRVWSLGWDDPCGEGNGNPLQYSCLENSRTEEPGQLQSMGWQRVRHDWATHFHPIVSLCCRLKILPHGEVPWVSAVCCFMMVLWGARDVLKSTDHDRHGTECPQEQNYQGSCPKLAWRMPPKWQVIF